MRKIVLKNIVSQGTTRIEEKKRTREREPEKPENIKFINENENL